MKSKNNSATIQKIVLSDLEKEIIKEVFFLLEKSGDSAIKLLMTHLLKEYFEL